MYTKIENIVYRASWRDEISANFEMVSFQQRLAITLIKRGFAETSGMERQPDYSGMTLNERLFSAGLLMDWDTAVQSRNRKRMVELLSKVDLADQADHAAGHNPSRPTAIRIPRTPVKDAEQRWNYFRRLTPATSCTWHKNDYRGNTRAGSIWKKPRTDSLFVLSRCSAFCRQRAVNATLNKRGKQ